MDADPPPHGVKLARRNTFKSPVWPAQLHLIKEGRDPSVDVIFIHGLDGDYRQTWNFQLDENWATWIHAKDPSPNIWSLSYRLASSNWFGGAMPLTDRAVNSLATIMSDLDRSRPIILVCHSYGGLLAKQMLRAAMDTATDFRPLGDRVRAIMFLGTPNNGSFVPGYLEAMNRVLRTSQALKELRHNSAQLRDLNSWFSNKFEPGQLSLKCYSETLKTKGVLVVDEASSNVNIRGVTPIPIDANHIDICKPKRADLRISGLLDLLKIVSGQRPQTARTPMQEVIAADNDQLPTVMAGLRARSRAKPTDHRLQEAIDYGDRLTNFEIRPEYHRSHNVTSWISSPLISITAILVGAIILASRVFPKLLDYVTAFWGLH